MRKLRLLFATLALLVTGVVAVNAEDVDYTSYITNANLASTEGWTLQATGGNWSGVQGSSPSFCIEAYAGWSSLTLTSYSMKQSVTLPSGNYRAEGYAFYRYGLNADTDASKSYAKFVAGDFFAPVVTLGGETLDETLTAYPNSMDQASAAFTNGYYKSVVEFSVESESSIEFGYEGTHPLKQSWFIAGPIKLYRTGDFTYTLYQNQLQDLVNQAKTYQGQAMSSAASSALSAAILNYDGKSCANVAAYQTAYEQLEDAITLAENSANAYAAFADVINVFTEAFSALDANGQAAYDVADENGVLANLQTAYDNGSLQEITSDQKATIANALAVAAKAQTSENSPMTWAILNHSFETGSLQAWTAENTAGDTGVKPNSNGTYTTIGCDGDFLFNTWNGDAVGYGISQTVTDMPAGSYKLTASFAGPANATVELFANSESTTVTQTAPGTFTDVDLEFDLATAGDITIGTQNSTSWYKVDNFRLILLQPAVVPDYTISLNVTGTNDMGDAPTITVAGATQSGDVAYTATANSTISITPEAVDGYSVEVTVTQTPATGGPEETVSASEVSGTWSFTLPENNVRVSIAYTPIPTYSINGLAYGSQVTIGEVSTTIGDVSTITGVNAGELVTIDVSGVTVSPGMVTMIHANTAAGALTEEALSHVGDVWTFTMPEGDAHLTFAEEYVYSTFTLNVTEGEGMTEAPNVSYSPQFTNAGKVRSGSNVTINIPAYAGYDATATYQAASDAEPTTLTISNNQAQLTMPAEDVTATVVYTKHAYTISGLPVDNTTFTIGDTQYESGDVTATVGTIITVTPDLGYQITAITATYTPATGGDPIELTIDDAAGNGKSFTMPAANVTVTCTAEEIVIDPNAIPVTVPALSFVTYVDNNQDLSLATGDQAQLYGVSDVTDTEVQLTAPLTDVSSGHHFLIYNPTDADIIAQLMPSAPTGGLEGVGNWFFLDINDGTINPDDYTGFTLYICGGKQFLKAIGAGQLADHRWMLMVANETEGGYGEKARNIVFGETTNKITATNIKNATKGDVFDLNGRKLDKMPTKKGVYIQNGKKVVVK